MIANIRRFCCCAFADDNKFERYERANGRRITENTQLNDPKTEFRLHGIGVLPNEIIAEFLFPHLGINDIRNLGAVGDSRLKCLSKDYLSNSMWLDDNIYIFGIS